MIGITASKEWKIKYPGALMGIMILQGVINPPQSLLLDEKKKLVEDNLRSMFSSRSDLESHPVIKVYREYYKHFRNNYHVQFQIESIAVKGKSIPSVAALVEAMFVAEVQNMLLTAGHDLDKLAGDITFGISNGDERYVLLNGKEQMLKRDDMLVADSKGVISSIIYGPDKRTRITEKTSNVLFTVYAPPGIEKEYVKLHLQDISNLAGLFSPDIRVERLEVYEARGE